MRPEARSRNLLAVTRAKAKMYEFNVAEDAHIRITEDPAQLFSLTIGILGDLSREVCTSNAAAPELLNSMRFSAHFFDAYNQSRLNTDMRDYLLLLGAAAYYLCDLPGNSNVLASRIDTDVLMSHCADPARLLHSLLMGRYSDSFASEHSVYGEQLSRVAHSFAEFARTGVEGHTLTYINSLRESTHSLGSARELLVVDTLCAVTKKMLANSVWRCLPYYSGIPIDEWRAAITKPTFIREMWPAQKRLGEHAVFHGTSAIVQMPTSAGKTKAAEIIIRSAFLSNRSSLAVVVAPFRALCHEIRDGLTRQFAGEPIRVSELSDVIQDDFELQNLLGHRQVIVVTPEKLSYVLRQEPDFANHIGLVIYDEGHLFDDPSRGVTYELLLASMKMRLRDDVQSILISAVISNAEDINRWLLSGNGRVVSGTELLPTYRSVAFASWTDTLGRLQFVDLEDPSSERGFFVPRVLTSYELQRRPREQNPWVFPHRDKGTEVALYLALKLASNGCVAIFTGRKDSASKLCSDLNEQYERGLPIDPPSVYSDPGEMARLHFVHVANFGPDAPVTVAASYGVFAHHGNTPQGIRLAVEYALQKGLAKCVICTSTLAQGVNLPLRYLIVSGIRQNRDPIKTRDFHNLIGRAGRSGMHTEGSIIFADPAIYDQRNIRTQNWRWLEARKLLNPANSETCSSHLFTLFEPLYNDRRDRQIRLEPVQFIERLLHNPQYVERIPYNIVSRYADRGYSLNGLQDQLESKKRIIADIESYLMANLADNPQGDEAIRQCVSSLVMNTLAYSLANDEQKQLLNNAFALLAENLIQVEPVIEKRLVFSRTLLGITECKSIEAWVDENGERLANVTDEDITELVWPLLYTHVKNSSFRGCNSEEVLQAVLDQWLHGMSFGDMLASLPVETVRISTRVPKIQHMVDICENAFAYEGSLIVGALLQLADYKSGNRFSQTSELLSWYQKRLKYGLATQREIAIHELGFVDRPLVYEISSLLGHAEPSQAAVVDALRENEHAVYAVLGKYPSYFTARFDAMLQG